MTALCRIVALKADKDICIETYFRFFRMMSERGINNPHGDGYGYAFRNSHEEVLYRSDVNVANALDERFMAKGTLLHSRKATGDYRRNLMQVHPFAASLHGKTYYFVHNGVISHISSREDVTDSQDYFERVLEMIIEGKNEAFSLQTVSNDIASKYEYTSLNAIITDLEHFWCLKLNADQGDTYHDFCFLEHDDASMICSEEPAKYVDIEGDPRHLENGELLII